jgi:hypothetical protein
LACNSFVTLSELQSVSDQYVEHIFYFVDVSLLKFLIILTDIYAAVTLPLIILTDIVLCNITLAINMLHIYSYMLLLHCLYCQFNMRCNELLSVQSVRNYHLPVCKKKKCLFTFDM